MFFRLGLSLFLPSAIVHSAPDSASRHGKTIGRHPFLGDSPEAGDRCAFVVDVRSIDGWVHFQGFGVLMWELGYLSDRGHGMKLASPFAPAGLGCSSCSLARVAKYCFT